MKETQSLKNKAALAPYKEAIARYIRSQMVLKNQRYDDLAIALRQKGIELTGSNLRNKVSKGLFSADMLLVILELLEASDSAVSEILKQVHHD